MKSVEIKFNEALSALDKIGKRQVFNEKASKLTTIETKLNAAEEILKGSRYIRKFNGASDNGHDDGYVREAANSNSVTEGDKLILEAMQSRGDITADQVRVALGQPPAEYANFTEAQKKEFDFARSIGISEVDALRLAKMTTTVGRRI